jgi:hypothetical protein
MKFLIKQEWDKFLSKLSLNKNNTQTETQIEKIFYEISQRIKDIIVKKISLIQHMVSP